MSLLSFQQRNGLTRRQLALIAISMTTPAGLFVSPSRSVAQPGGLPETALPASKVIAFLAFSKGITGHAELDATTASRILEAMSRADGAFDAHAPALAGMLRPDSSPETLLQDATAAGLRDAALAVVAAWYTGTVGHGPQAVTVAYVNALMYQPVRDALTVPTYCSRGPLWWTAAPPDVGVAPPAEAARRAASKAREQAPSHAVVKS